MFFCESDTSPINILTKIVLFTYKELFLNHYLRICDFFSAEK
jgi:hypothetical protein